MDTIAPIDFYMFLCRYFIFLNLQKGVPVMDDKQDDNNPQQDNEKKPTSYWKLFLYGMGGIVVIELIQALMR